MEVMLWRKSSYSANGTDTCVEVARPGSQKIAARDSKNPVGPILEYGRLEWQRFIEQVKAGRHDLT
jgi:hypothetical protein